MISRCDDLLLVFRARGGAYPQKLPESNSLRVACL